MERSLRKAQYRVYRNLKIGFESDLELAGLLKPEWGIDMILGGHTHTILDQPEIVNYIIIAQAGYGTDQIGRFDIVVDEVSNLFRT